MVSMGRAPTAFSFGRAAAAMVNSYRMRDEMRCPWGELLQRSLMAMGGVRSVR